MSSFSFFHWLIFGAIVFFFYSMAKGFKSSGSENMVCKTCGHVGAAHSAVRGSLLIEIALWLCFIVPGLIYSLWRFTSRHNACPQCGSDEMIPADSPIGRKIIDDNATQ